MGVAGGIKQWNTNKAIQEGQKRDADHQAETVILLKQILNELKMLNMAIESKK